MGKVKYRKYFLKLKGDKELLTWLEKYVPKEIDSMGVAFQLRRALLQIFPDLSVRVISKQVKFKPVIRDITR